MLLQVFTSLVGYSRTRGHVGGRLLQNPRAQALPSVLLTVHLGQGLHYLHPVVARADPQRQRKEKIRK